MFVFVLLLTLTVSLSRAQGNGSTWFSAKTKAGAIWRILNNDLIVKAGAVFLVWLVECRFEQERKQTSNKQRTTIRKRFYSNSLFCSLLLLLLFFVFFLTVQTKVCVFFLFCVLCFDLLAAKKRILLLLQHRLTKRQVNDDIYILACFSSFSKRSFFSERSRPCRRLVGRRARLVVYARQQQERIH